MREVILNVKNTKRGVELILYSKKNTNLFFLKHSSSYEFDEDRQLILQKHCYIKIFWKMSLDQITIEG